MEETGLWNCLSIDAPCAIPMNRAMFACDIDLLAARLGLSEVQVGHKGEESSLVL
jgi:hypothetical protein